MGGLLLLVAAAGVAYPLWWDHQSTLVGHALLERALHPAPVAADAKHPVATCARASTTVGVPGNGGSARASVSTAGPATRQHPGVLEIPAIGLEAPVLQGVTDAVFTVAVGHYPGSAWPGSSGESLLLAHDVSYFSGLDHVRNGDEVIWIDGCREVLFRVVRHEITQPGASIPVPPSGTGLALVTCWPTDALFWTSDRYVVETAFVGERLVDRAAAVVPSSPLHLSLPAPPALQAEGLSLARSGVLVGHLSMTGSPSRSFREGPAPLEVANLALRDYAAAEKTASAQDRSWWTALALAAVPLPAPWSLRYDTNVTLSVAGSTVEGAILSSPAGTVTLTVRHATFYVANVTPPR